MSTEQITDIDVDDELRTSFLSYAMSVIVARALPDVRDGLKPVHRRILYSMARMHLDPDKAHVKSARVVGEVMGKYHPHGDSAIYEAMVRLAQPWSQRVLLVDGHGNFGTHTDGPAAARYTEARMAKAAVAMTADIDEDTVDFAPNYDGKFLEPTVLPAAIPNLLVNGTEGIAVGMATRMAPHNLTEVIAACKHMLTHPDATVDELMAFIPGPDLPTGGLILNPDGIREAYDTGRGSFTMRARTHIEQVSARRVGIVVSELPYQVGPEHVIAAIKAQRDKKHLAGVASVIDLSDRKTGTKVVIEVKSGFQPEAVLAELLKRTPLQRDFHIHALALVDGQPRTLPLNELVGHYVNHRRQVTVRRCEFRKAKAEARAHLLQGFLLVLANLLEVIETIRKAKDTATARAALTKKYALDDEQASAVLEMPLRRLTGLEVTKVRTELAELTAQIKELTRLLGSPTAMNTLIASEFDEMVAAHGTPRRSELTLTSPVVPAVDEAAAKIPLADTTVTLSTTGLLSHWTTPMTGKRGKHDALIAQVATTTHATISAVTSDGRAVHIPVLDIPPGGTDRGAPIKEFVDLAPTETVVGLLTLDPSVPVAMATRGGVVKVLNAADLPKKSGQTIIALKDDDALLSAVPVPANGADLIFITSDGSLLRTSADAVRPQGRTGGGVAGIKLAPGAAVIAFSVVAPDTDPVVVTVAAGTAGTSVKSSALSGYPTKGRATGGVRAHRLLRGENLVVAAGVGTTLVGVSTTGALVPLPGELARRDGSGTRTDTPLAAVAVRR